jgi:hypothetical protein
MVCRGSSGGDNIREQLQGEFDKVPSGVEKRIMIDFYRVGCDES